MKRIHILRAGKFRDHHGRDVAIDARVLSDVVGSYDRQKHRAPLVLGHPKDDASSPAYGEVASLEAGPDGVHAVPDKVSPGLAEAVRAGRYGPVSASLYAPAHPNNPTPGKWHLRHIGFLGATPPVVKGLSPVAMAELADAAPDQTVTVELADASMPIAWAFDSIARTFRSIREWLIDEKDTETANRLIPNSQIESIARDARRVRESARDDAAAAMAETQPGAQEAHDMTDRTLASELAESQSQNESLRARLAASEARAKAAEEKAEREAVEAAVTELCEKGIVLPADKAVVVDMLLRHGDAEADRSADFAEPGSAEPQTPRARALSFFRRQRPQVPLGALSPDPVTGAGHTDFDRMTDAERHAAVVAFAETNAIDLRAPGGYDKALDGARARNQAPPR